jgi:hypothetical protein
MMPASRILLIFALTFYLYIGFSLYGHCLIDISFGLSGIFISPNSPVTPFISVKVVGKKSMYSHNNSVILSTVFSSH